MAESHPDPDATETVEKEIAAEAAAATVVRNHEGTREEYTVEQAVKGRFGGAQVSLNAGVNARIAEGELVDHVRHNEHVAERAVDEGCFYARLHLPGWFVLDDEDLAEEYSSEVYGKGDTLNVDVLIEDYSEKAWRIVATEADSMPGDLYFNWSWCFVPKSLATVEYVEGVETQRQADSVGQIAHRVDREQLDEGWSFNDDDDSDDDQGGEESDDQDSEDPEAELEAFAGDVSEGDRVRVEYEQKNGEGTNDKAGTVHSAGVLADRLQVAFRRDDDQLMRVELDDDGNPALYTVNSHAPYVGAVTQLERVETDDSDDETDVEIVDHGDDDTADTTDTSDSTDTDDQDDDGDDGDGDVDVDAAHEVLTFMFGGHVAGHLISPTGEVLEGPRVETDGGRSPLEQPESAADVDVDRLEGAVVRDDDGNVLGRVQSVEHHEHGSTRLRTYDTELEQMCTGVASDVIERVESEGARFVLNPEQLAKLDGRDDQDVDRGEGIETDGGRDVDADEALGELDVAVDRGVWQAERGDVDVATVVEILETHLERARELEREQADQGDAVDRGRGVATDGGHDVDQGVDVVCPCCGETEDIKRGAALHDGRTFDYGCRSCLAPFDARDAGRATPTPTKRCGVTVRNPCRHDTVMTEYVERPDGQHEVTVCENCSRILADHGHPEPSNVE